MARSGGLILLVICFCCVILPLVIYAITWSTNVFCDVNNPAPQKWAGMNCPSVYVAPPVAPQPPPAMGGAQKTTGSSPAKKHESKSGGKNSKVN